MRKAYIKIIQLVPLMLLVLLLCALCGCGKEATYTQISQEEAMKMMAERAGYLIIDVRTPEEYAEVHITGAINVPNEDISVESPESLENVLPDKDQLLLVYCRSGNRSKDASQKLADMGYTNVYEFGGINTWEGEVVTGESPEGDEPAEDGLTEEGSAEEQLADEQSAEEQPTEEKPGEEQQTWNQPTEEQTIEEQLPGEQSTEEQMTEEQSNMVKITYEMDLMIGDTRVNVDWEDNEAVIALAKRASRNPLEIKLSGYGGFEQVGDLGEALPTSNEQITTEPGDIVLYSGNQIVLFYGSNSWSYTKLGHIKDKSAEELSTLLGGSDVTIRIWVELSE